MTKSKVTVLNGTRGLAEWEGGFGMGALNDIDGAMLMAIRTSARPVDGSVVTLNLQRWKVLGESTATVPGMRLLRVEQASNIEA